MIIMIHGICKSVSACKRLKNIRVILLGSMMLFAVSLASGINVGPAFADCEPDPAAQGATVNCTGIDKNGFFSSSHDLLINVFGTVSGIYDAFTLDGDRVQVINAGTITAGTDGIQFNGDDITLDNSGILTGGDQVGVEINGLGATVTNSGTISGQDGIRVQDSSASGTVVDNSGTITGNESTGIQIRGDSTALNTGMISGAHIGVLIDGSGTSLTNFVGGEISVRISESPWAGVGLGGDTLTVTNQGLITSNGSGLAISSTDTNVTNMGDILSNGNAIYVYPEAIGLVITNLGTMTSEKSAGLGIKAPGAMIRNTNDSTTGTISGFTDGIWCNGDDLTVINSGMITGGKNGIAIADTATNTSITNESGATISGALAAILGNDGVQSVTNSGTLEGDIDLGAGNDTFTNTGITNGNVDLGDGDDTFMTDFENGTITGTLEGGAGEDALIINGEGTFDFPEYAVGLEAVTIAFANMIIADGPITLDSLFSGGSLDVQKTLTIQTEGRIENLKLNADLIANGPVNLRGNSNYWNTGAIQGASVVGLDADRELTIEPAAGTLDLRTALKVSGTATQKSGTLNLEGAEAMLSIGTGGTYKLESGNITDTTDGVHIVNEGTFSKQTIATATVDAFLENKLGGNVTVTEGLLEFTTPSTWIGNLGISPSATVEFRTTSLTLGDPSGNGPTFTGEGVVRFSNASILVSASSFTTLAVGENVNLSKANVLDRGVEIVNGTNLTGSGDLGNFGAIAFNDGTLDGPTLTNYKTGGLIVFGGAEGDDRIINSPFINQGRALQTASITLGTNGRIDNQHEYTLYGAVSITPGAGDEADIPMDFFENGEDALLTKNGEGEARIEVTFLNQGKIILDKGNLTFAAQTIFNPDDLESTIYLEAGAGEKLCLQGTEPHEFRGTTIVRGKADAGTFVLDGPVSMAPGAKLINLCAMEWRSGDFFFELGNNAEDRVSINIGEYEEAGTLKIMGDQKVVDQFGTITVEEGGMVVQGADLLLDDVAGRAIDAAIAAHILVKGLYHLKGDLKGVYGSLAVDDGGILHAEDPGVRMLEVRFDVYSNGTVRVDAGTTLDIPNVVTIVRPLNFTTDALMNGHWELGKNARINLFERVDDPKPITQLIEGVSVKLAQGASFNNLPNVAGDFRLDKGAALHLNGSTFTVSGDFYNEGQLSGDGGTVVVGGVLRNQKSDLSVLTDFFVGGSLTIIGTVENSGVVAPGSSPGVITVDGDYTQTATGVLEIEIGGTDAGTEYDQLIVNKTATFEQGAIINVTLIDLDGDGKVYVPETSDTFDFIRADKLVLAKGTDLTDYLTIANMPDGLQWEFVPVNVGGAIVWQIHTEPVTDEEMVPAEDGGDGGVACFIDSLMR